LDRIKVEINTDVNIEVTLLIEANCVRTLELRKVIASKNGDPYDFKTLLGWCIVGPMESQNKLTTVCCNRIMVSSHGKSNSFITQPIEVKDNSIENLLQKLYENDFVETDNWSVTN